VYFTNEWKGSIQVSVPRDRTSSKERRGNEGCSGVYKRLSRHQSDIMPGILMDVTDLECVGGRSAGRREPDLLEAVT
jgi:hypothetical protein